MCFRSDFEMQLVFLLLCVAAMVSAERIHGMEQASCYLPKQSSVEYHCLDPDLEGHRECNEYEPSDTVVRPSCRQNFYYPATLPLMRCLQGNWNYIAICFSDCGKIPEGGTGLPWHVTINRKEQDDTDFKALCGGSIISNTLIVTAAHCFKPMSYSKVKLDQYKVVVPGGTQSLNVSDIKLPDSFLGDVTNYQSDIALVKLKTPLEFSTQVQPVCVDFDVNFEKRQLQQGSIGKVTVSTESKENRPSFKVLEIPYIHIVQCITKAPPNFTEFITSDKFCAGQSNGTVISRGNSGSGISFSDEDRGVVRHYLRGVVSVSPYREDIGAASDIVAFTQINKHEYFIKENFV